MLLYNHNHIIKLNFLCLKFLLKRYMTTTETVTITKTEAKTPMPTTENKDASGISSMEIDTKPESLPTNDIQDRIEKNNKALEDILKRPRISIEDLEQASSESTLQKPISSTEQIKQDNIMDGSSPSSSSDSYSDISNISNQVQFPSTEQNMPQLTNEIEAAVLPIIAASKLVGQALAEKAEQTGLLLQETEDAEKRQEALYLRIKEFVASFGISNRALKIGAGLAVGYTIYHLLRYRQIPLGGFIKGMFTGGSSSAAPDMMSNVASPTNNIMKEYK